MPPKGRLFTHGPRVTRDTCPAWTVALVLFQILENALDRLRFGHRRNPTNLVELTLPNDPSVILGDRIGFFNREYIGSDNVVSLDNVCINLSGCSASNYCSSAAHSGGLNAKIGMLGDTSIAANDFTLTVQDAKPLQYGLFFYVPSRIEDGGGNRTRTGE